MWLVRGESALNFIDGCGCSRSLFVVRREEDSCRMKVFWRLLLLLLPRGNDRRKVWVKVVFIRAAWESCMMRFGRID